MKPLLILLGVLLTTVSHAWDDSCPEWVDKAIAARMRDAGLPYETIHETLYIRSINSVDFTGMGPSSIASIKRAAEKVATKRTVDVLFGQDRLRTVEEIEKMEEEACDIH